MSSESELYSTERLKHLVKLTGDIEIDAVANLRETLRRELKNDDKFGLSAIEIYDIDTELIPRFPAICLDFKGSTQEQRTIGKERCTFMRTINVELWYYHADVNQKNIEMEIRRATSRIISVVSRNADLNGYCRMGVKIKNSRIIEKVFGENIIKGSLINIDIPILYRDRSSGPG